MIVHFARQMLLALNELHGFRLIHRECSPSNFLLFDDKLTLKLTGFGCAKVTKETVFQCATQVGDAQY